MLDLTCAAGRHSFSCVTELADIQLPVLRGDLEFHPGPAAPDGTPTFTLFDPVSERYSKLTWIEATLLQFLRPGMNLSQLMGRLRRETTIRVDPREVVDLLEQAERACLLAGTSRRKGERLLQQARARDKTPVQWLLAHYLFFCIPLLRPDRFLDRTLHRVRFLASTPALVIYALLSACGLILVAVNIERYLRTFASFFNLWGICLYGLVLVAVKCIHEFAHAYTAKHYGANVRSMGIAFVVFWPRPFCDVTDSWKLASRGRRFLIALAGVLSELVLAGCSLLLWYLAPPGPWRGIFFVLSSVTVVSTLLVNLNPAMRYDGYYLLTDLTGVENLQPRAFAVAKWQLRKWLLGLQAPPPEADLKRRRIAWMLAYSLYTWVYRFFLYLGIAVLVYYEFTKALGAILFAVEMYVFILGPVVREFKEIMRMRKALTLNPRSSLTLFAGGLLLAWLALPLPRREVVQGVVVPRSSQVLYAPQGARVRAILAGRGSRVTTGQVLLRLGSEKLKTDLRLLTLERQVIERQLANIAADEKANAFSAQKREELARVEARLQGVRDRLQALVIRARLNGMVSALAPDLRVGMYVARGAVLGRVTDPARVKVVGYLSEQQVARVETRGAAVFVDGADNTRYRARVTYQSAVQAARIDYPSLTSIAHGDIAVRNGPGNTLVPAGSWYRVELGTAGVPGARLLGHTGFVVFTTRPRSRLADIAGYLGGVLLRESGF